MLQVYFLFLLHVLCAKHRKPQWPATELTRMWTRRPTLEKQRRGSRGTGKQSWPLLTSHAQVWGPGFLNTEAANADSTSPQSLSWQHSLFLTRTDAHVGDEGTEEAKELPGASRKDWLTAGRTSDNYSFSWKTTYASWSGEMYYYEHCLTQLCCIAWNSVQVDLKSSYIQISVKSIVDPWVSRLDP